MFGLGLLFGGFGEVDYASDDRQQQNSHRAAQTQSLPRNEGDVYDLAEQFCNRHGLPMQASPALVAHDAFHEILGNPPDIRGEIRQFGAQMGAGIPSAVEDMDGYEDEYQAGFEQGQNFAHRHPDVVRLLKRFMR